ncbi:polysaccharide pyruvyl transferase family protein [Microbacterium sp. MPKO10]|uniref:polysaccharide pyruvyl transferase family protein n=1 Tax=Microbacterium sp. MPKO10 TaxID=2989818 RepID=UPI002235D3B5|nr:polysaccharide pyruvyl transferase family protein [Microbacterium sp. MPKO10]MCW4457821.1 polysaccharide pyruvyl transferase family protein [Microbacterium sp. MPKO10]
MPQVSAGPKIAMIGDVGWAGLYHLGDEAMTEAAIKAMQDRGVTDITLIAAEARPARERYGVKAIDRLGFGPRWSRTKLDDRYRTLVADIENDFGSLPENDPAHAILSLLRAADAVLIAGGGNITSRYLYHVYERSVLVKIAKEARKPVFLTSQTIGPSIDDDHRGIIAEILEGSQMVAARENHTFELINDLTQGRAPAYRSVDDAFLLKATEADHQWSASLDLDEGYAVASVSPHIANAFWAKDFYYQQMAEILDAVANQMGQEILLIPHAGSPLPDDEKHDQLSHQQVVSLSTSGRLRPLPVISATQSLAIMAKATMAISTRYHPIVLGQRVGIPTISIGMDPYSFVRMHGAQQNFGTQALHLPAKRATPETVASMAQQLTLQRQKFVSHIDAIKKTREEESSRWWDTLVEQIKAPSDIPKLSFAKVDALHLDHVPMISRCEFDAYNEFSVVTKSLQVESNARIRAEKSAAQAKRDRDALSVAKRQSDAESRSLREELRAANSRKVVRIADTLGRLVRSFVRR